ncbi:hypothetical protein PG991_015205 [Apiospora marii]|uniref:Uncharacterized protein n=1 Tax=Apiospora marii TaxID=335849 RepID=A0ABR1R3E7_9PEZI
MSTVAVETTLSSSTPVASQDTPITPPTPRPTQSTMATSDVTTKDTWERRDIAYLKSQEELEKEFQEVVLGQELHCGATGHPCIIMDMSPNRQHALVTTISSFSSGPHNNYLPPWKQTWHRAKDPDRFRSFAGTDHYSASRSFLYLEGGRRVPQEPHGLGLRRLGSPGPHRGPQTLPCQQGRHGRGDEEAQARDAELDRPVWSPVLRDLDQQRLVQRRQAYTGDISPQVAA